MRLRVHSFLFHYPLWAPYKCLREGVWHTKKEPQDFYVLWSCFLLCFTDVFICNLAYVWHTAITPMKNSEILVEILMYLWYNTKKRIRYYALSDFAKNNAKQIIASI